jgi:hypothetical protein
MDVSAAVGLHRRAGDRHLALQRRMVGLELGHLDHLLVRHEPGKMAVIGVGVAVVFPAG